MHPHDDMPRCQRDPVSGEAYLEIQENGDHLLSYPLLNKGTAFTAAEREQFGLEGHLPPRVCGIREQVERALENLADKSTDLGRYLYLRTLMDRNETLFYRVVLENIEALLPIVYTPTVGLACQRFSHLFRRGRGLYLCDRDVDRVDRILDNWPRPDVRLIVVTDGERILGLGDLGVDGMGIPIGKLALYVVAAGVSPWQVLPVCLDVGTNNQTLLDDPLYLGQRKPRLRGERYDALIDAFLTAVKRRYPRCLVQFEDFAHRNSFPVLDRYREQILCFNDDIQGTGAVTYAGLVTSQRLTGLGLTDQRIVIVGGGSAGIGIGRQIVAGMAAAGLSEAQAKERLWLLDSRGLITAERPDLGRHPQKQAFARPAGDLPDLAPVLAVVQAVKPTALIGATGQPGLFTPAVLEALGEGTERPVIFALSNPTSKCECTPEQAYRCTGGRALCATGSPFPAFEYEGRTVIPGQSNNVYIFPGLGLGALAAEARWLPDTVFLRAAEALAESVPEASLAAGTLYPPLDGIRAVSRAVAMATAREVVRLGLSPLASAAEVPARVDALVWEPEYLPYRRGR